MTQSGLISAATVPCWAPATRSSLCPRSRSSRATGPPQPSLCGQPYRLIVQLWLSSDAPTPRSYVVAALGQDSTPCNSANGLSCRVAANYSHIDLAFANCLVTVPQYARRGVAPKAARYTVCCTGRRGAGTATGPRPCHCCVNRRWTRCGNTRCRRTTCATQPTRCTCARGPGTRPCWRPAWPISTSVATSTRS